MAGKRILLARAEVNMIAADDVYTADDQLLIPADTVLTEDVIAALKEHSVFAIHIKVDEKDKKTPIFYEPDDTKDVEPETAAQDSETAQNRNSDTAKTDESRKGDQVFAGRSRIIRKNKRKKIIMKRFVNLLSLRHFMRNF